MKKFLVLMMALMMMLTGAALAENIPAPDFGTRDGTAQETAAPAATEGYTVPSGRRTFQYTMVEDGGVGFMMREWEITDSVRAEEPDEKSPEITPEFDGMKLVHIRYVHRFRTSTALDTIQGAVVDGTQQVYPADIYLEGSRNLISSDNVVHGTVDCNSHSNSFLLPVSGSTKTIGSSTGYDWFMLCDFIAEIPEALAESDMPLFLTVKVGATDYYIRLQK